MNLLTAECVLVCVLSGITRLLLVAKGISSSVPGFLSFAIHASNYNVCVFLSGAIVTSYCNGSGRFGCGVVAGTRDCSGLKGEKRHQCQAN